MIECSEEDAEELAQIHVVRCFVKTQPATIIQVHGEFGWKSFAEHFNRGRHFLFN